MTEQQRREGLRPGLAEIMPARIRARPVDARGYPVPWFVQWIDGVPDFRAMDPAKLERAIIHRRCWICGEPLGRFMTFVIGPMCMINRVSSEPPSHRECAEFAAKACPFLSIPAAQYREANRPEHYQLAAGQMQTHNPTACLLWTTRGFNLFPVDNGVLLEIGDPEEMEFWSRGRIATRDEVLHAINIGIPILRAAAAKEIGASERLEHRISGAMHTIDQLYPPP